MIIDPKKLKQYSEECLEQAMIYEDMGHIPKSFIDKKLEEASKYENAWLKALKGDE